MWEKVTKNKILNSGVSLIELRETGPPGSEIVEDPIESDHS